MTNMLQTIFRRGSRAEANARPAPPTSVDTPAEPPNAPGRDELIAAVRSFPYWYQRIYLGHGVYTLDQPAHHEGIWKLIERAIPADLRGASVLDVGTNAGYFALQMKARGAGRVVGLESIDDYLRQAEFCRKVWNADIQYIPIDAHDVGSLREEFDLVVFTGILYHLKNPLQVLEDVGRRCRDAIVVETEVLTEHPENRVHVRQGPTGQLRVTACSRGIMKFIERDELNGDGSNWWVPDTECVMGMLRTAGFTCFSTPRYPADNRLLILATKASRSLLSLDAIR